MTTWRFVHAADLHLDSPFVGLKNYQEKLAQDLMEATFTAFRRIVDLCLERQAEFLLLAGDLFDGPGRSLRAQLFLRRELARLAAAGIETFIVHGNHDHLGGKSVTLNWSDRVHVFPAGQVEMAEVRRQGATLARIYGLSHAGPEESDNLARKFPAPENGPLAIGLLHANLDRNSEHENYAPCSLADLTSLTYDYWALGHIHRPGIRREAQPTVVYAGNPQGRHVKEAGPRGCYLVEVDGRHLLPVFQPTGVIGWDEARQDVSALENLDQVLQALEQTLEEHRPDPPQQGSILRLSLQGRGPAHRELQVPGTVEEILEQLREAGQSREPWVWVERLIAATAPAWDLAALSRGTDLVATLLGQLAAARESQEPAPEIQKLLQPLYHQPLAHRYLPALESLDQPDLLDEVTADLLGRLLPEED
ncbi:MAG: metallophosphoesterase family protein [Desulfobaccales bacterium]